MAWLYVVLMLLVGCAAELTPYALELDEEALGVEYAHVASDAAAVWEARTGLAVFSDVDAKPLRVTAFAGACVSVDDGRPLYGQFNPNTDQISFCRSSMEAESKSTSYAHAVLMHELGHALGLDHSDDAHNLMHATTPANWTISDAQIEQIKSTVQGARVLSY